MQKLIYKKVRRAVPNHLEYTGIHKDIDVSLQMFTYDADTLIEYPNLEVKNIDGCIQNGKNNWINMYGLHNAEIIKEVGKKLHVDDFILSDIVNVNKRSKVEEFHKTLFFNIRAILPIEDNKIETEHLSFILKDGLLFSFQEKPNSFFNHIRERLRINAGIVRNKKVDYLLYLLLDSLIEVFYETIENEENKVDSLIDLIKSKLAKTTVLSDLEECRDNLFYIRKSITPLRDSLHTIKSTKDDDIFNEIADENYTFFDRLYQKSLELLEQIDSDIATVESASQFYFSIQNQRMNEVMKTLTVVSVFFMPMTFLTGLYGMNFDFLPGSHEKHGFFVLCGAMFILLLIMLIYFKRRRWF